MALHAAERSTGYRLPATGCGLRCAIWAG